MNCLFDKDKKCPIPDCKINVPVPEPEHCIACAQIEANKIARENLEMQKTMIDAQVVMAAQHKKIADATVPKPKEKPSPPDGRDVA